MKLTQIYINGGIKVINHLDLKVSDLEKSRNFYKHILIPLGYKEKLVTESVVSFSDNISSDPMGDIYIGKGEVHLFHFAFQAKDHQAVQDFHSEGLKNGGQNNGNPGYREYHSNYYASYLIDPDGYRIEAVCHL